MKTIFQSTWREWHWVGLVVFLSALCIYNVAERRRLVAEVSARAATWKSSYEALTTSQKAVEDLSGRVMTWPTSIEDWQAGTRIIDYRGHKTNRSRMVVLLDADDCQNIREPLTGVLRVLQADLGTLAPKALFVLIQAEDLVVSRSYEVTNRFSFPVLLDHEARFREENRLPAGPLALVLDTRDRVVAAYTSAGRGVDLLTSFVARAKGLLTSE